MVKREKIEEIQQDFNNVIEEKKIQGLLLFGSSVLNQNTNRSDIDICVVAPEENVFDLLSYITKNINVVKKKYDTRIFSELPLFIKIQIIEDGILVYSPNKYDLYEFFYFYRKIWADQKHRQKISKIELLSL